MHLTFFKKVSSRLWFWKLGVLNRWRWAGCIHRPDAAVCSVVFVSSSNQLLTSTGQNLKTRIMVVTIKVEYW